MQSQGLESTISCDVEGIFENFLDRPSLLCDNDGMMALEQCYRTKEEKTLNSKNF